MTRFRDSVVPRRAQPRVGVEYLSSGHSGACSIPGSRPSIVSVLTVVLLFAQGDAFAPARRLSGSLPSVPPAAVLGWVEETLELTVDAAGRVAGVTTLRATPGPSMLPPVIGDWLFRPAENRRPVASHVLVAAMFRPPSLYDGPVAGPAPADVAAPSSDVPFPTATTRPPYPPLAITDAIVLVEVLVGPDGRVSSAEIVQSAPGFDEVSLTSARGWSFRPARRNGRPAEAYAYLVFGFRRPI